MKNQNLTFLIFLSMFLFTVTKSEKTSKSQLEIEEEEKQEHLFLPLILNEHNFNSYIKNNFLLVLFHNPWCKYSQLAEKKLILANKQLKHESSFPLVGVVDVSITDIDKLNVQALNSKNMTYPYFALFGSGNFKETYKGKILKEDIHLYLKRKIYPLSEDISIVEIFQDKVINDRKAFILNLNFNSKKSDFDVKIFNEIAKDNLDATFYTLKNERVISFLKMENKTLAHFNYGKEIDAISLNLEGEEELTQERILSFISKFKQSNFYFKYDENAIQDIFIDKHPALIFFRNQYDNKTEDFEKEFIETFKDNTKFTDLKFIITDLSTKYDLKLANLLGVLPDTLPTIRIVDFKTGKFLNFNYIIEIIRFKIC